MTQHILLCTDMDRTLIPNGSAAESAQARPIFAKLVERPEVVLAYVTGRHKEIVQEAIGEFNLPEPDYVISDVGTTIYQVTDKKWLEWPQWSNEIAADWLGMESDKLYQFFSHIEALQLQEASKQNRFKLSFYLSLQNDLSALLTEMRDILSRQRIKAELIYSVDEPEQLGLLDVLPACATKFHAIEFLMQQLNFDLDHTVFAGDSGNDIPVLASSIHSVLVKNASSEVKEEAIETAANNATEQSLFLAQGGFLTMNGNYSAGILEGVAHYLPQTRKWMTSDEE